MGVRTAASTQLQPYLIIIHAQTQVNHSPIHATQKDIWGHLHLWAGNWLKQWNSEIYVQRKPVWVFRVHTHTHTHMYEKKKLMANCLQMCLQIGLLFHATRKMAAWTEHGHCAR